MTHDPLTCPSCAPVATSRAYIDAEAAAVADLATALPDQPEELCRFGRGAACLNGPSCPNPGHRGPR